MQKSHLTSLTLGTFFFLTAFSLIAQVGDSGDKKTQEYHYPEMNVLSHTQPELNSKEQEALKLAKSWMDRKDLPAIKDNGKIVYLYGATLPSIVCAPLHSCDLQLESGEIVKDVHVGDTVRWKVMPATSGLGEGATTHLIIKPTDAGLVSTMVITTDRRTYHIKLVSDRKKWMPSVGFEYPESIMAHWQDYYQRQQHKISQQTIPETQENIANLNFDYKILGKARWKPLRVYNNGLKTIIQMPKAMTHSEAPALLVIGPDKKEQLVNYRIHKDRYVVDQIFDEAILVAGVGRSQSRVSIKREGAAL